MCCLIRTFLRVSWMDENFISFLVIQWSNCKVDQRSFESINFILNSIERKLISSPLMCWIDRSLWTIEEEKNQTKEWWLLHKQNFNDLITTFVFRILLLSYLHSNCTPWGYPMFCKRKKKKNRFLNKENSYKTHIVIV